MEASHFVLLSTPAIGKGHRTIRIKPGEIVPLCPALQLSAQALEHFRSNQIKASHFVLLSSYRHRPRNTSDQTRSKRPTLFCSPAIGTGPRTLPIKLGQSVPLCSALRLSAHTTKNISDQPFESVPLCIALPLSAPRRLRIKPSESVPLSSALQ